MRRVENIDPAVLTWARETAGLARDEAARLAGLTTSTRSSGAEKLERLETGRQHPTQAQLERLARVYRRPLVSLYLAEPPRRADRGGDFRTMTSDVSTREDALLDTLLRDLSARQEMVRALLEDEEGAEPLPFVASATMDDGVGVVARSIADTLGFDPFDERERRGSKTDLFRRLRTRAEGVHVFVLLAGDLGSSHTDIAASVFRGYAIADPVAPFVVINDNDAPAARSFSLLHELAHIWLGVSGVSGTPTTKTARSEKARLERFCNDVASELLLPHDVLTPELPPAGLDPKTVDAIISRVADHWSVSHSMVAYRLLREKRVSPAMYEDLVAAYKTRWELERERRREKARSGERGGPSSHVIRRDRLGRPLISLVRRSLHDDVITSTTAARILHVKPTSVAALLEATRSSALDAARSFGRSG